MILVMIIMIISRLLGNSVAEGWAFLVQGVFSSPFLAVHV